MEISPTFIQNLTELRHEFHSEAEMSRKEVKTSAKVIAELSKLSPTSIISGIGGTGVVAIFDSGVPGPKVLFRGELDALPIQEVNNFCYQSCNAGISHKCGHDGHLTTVLGVAQLVDIKKPKKGAVMFLFQPAEETGSGAQSMLEDPAFADINPDYVFAYHNVPGHPLGQVILRKGAMTASVRSLIIRLHGRTSHAAEPECGTSPALALAHLLQQLDALSNNTKDREDFCVITPVHMNMGEVAYGIAAGYGELHLTMRTWTEGAMTSLIASIITLIDATTATHHLTYDLEWVEIFVANENKDDAVDLLADAASSTDCDVVFSPHPFKWGEDFGHFTAKFNGAFFCIGAGVGHPALHNNDYDFPDEILEIGMLMFTGVLLNPKLGMY
jgi:amidohydrolase